MDRNRIVVSILYGISVFILLLTGNIVQALLLSSLICLFMLNVTAYLGYLLYLFAIFSVAISDPGVGLLSSLLLVIPFTYLYRDEIKSILKENLGFFISLACLLLFKLKLSYAVIPLAIIFYYKKFDSRIFVGTAIILLIASAYVLSNANEAFANSIAITAYYFLVLGVLGSLLEYLRENKSDGDAVDKGVDDHSCN